MKVNKHIRSYQPYFVFPRRLDSKSLFQSRPSRRVLWYFAILRTY